MKHQQVLELAVRYLIAHREKALIERVEKLPINSSRKMKLEKEITQVEKLRKELERDFAILSRSF